MSARVAARVASMRSGATPVHTWYALCSVRATIRHMVEHRGRSREEAYAITSVAADLKILEVVDVPNWVVGAFLPDGIFAEAG